MATSVPAFPRFDLEGQTALVTGAARGIGRSRPRGSALVALMRVQQLARAASLSAGTYRDEFAVLRQVVNAASDLFRQ